MTEARTCKLHRTSSTVCRRHKPCTTNRLTYFARQPVRCMRKGMLHAIIAFFARQRFFTSIDVNVVLPRQPIKQNETVTVTISFCFLQQPHFFGSFLAVRRGFYPNPRNAPCIKRLHALPRVVGYTLVTRFYTSKSASMNVLSMNLYTANVTSFSGTCKLLSLNIFNSYRLFYILFFMFATGSETAQ